MRVRVNLIINSNTLCKLLLFGVTIFKGYAFVQYSNLSEADLAVSALNLYHWHGSALDVKVVAKETVKPTIGGAPITSIGSSNGSTGKRPAQTDHLNESTKKGRQQQQHQTTTTTTDISATNNENKNEIPDIFICGVCRFTSSNLETFVEHRKNTCDLEMARKIEGEPEIFECCSCDEKFITSWNLVDHLGKSHNLSVYKEAAALSTKDPK